MERVRVIGLLVVVSMFCVPPALAGPVTGESGDVEGSATATSFSFGSLFDPAGTPLLQSSAPLYLQLADRNKLRDFGGGGGGGISYDLGAPGGGACCSIAAPGVAGAVGDNPLVGNLAPEFTVGSDVPALPAGLRPVSIPEPATLLLLAPAALIALRRRARTRH
jgi:hypothetical protein